MYYIGTATYKTLDMRSMFDEFAMADIEVVKELSFNATNDEEVDTYLKTLPNKITVRNQTLYLLDLRITGSS